MQHVKAVGLMNREEENPRLKNPILPRCVESSLSSPFPQNTCGSCWLGTAQQFYLNMRGKVDHELPVKARGTHTPTHGLAITSRVRTAISRGKWQPWTPVVPGQNPCIFFLFRGGHTWQSAMPSHPFNNKEHRHSTVRHHTIFFSLLTTNQQH